MYEIGIFGVLSLIALLTVLIFTGWQTYLSIKNINLRKYAAVLWLFLLFISTNTYYYPLDVEPVAIYYWFFAGVLLKLADIDRQEISPETESPN